MPDTYTPTKEEIKQFMNKYGEDFQHVNDTFFREEEPYVDGIYVDLACLKDTRMGLMLALCQSPETKPLQKYLASNLRAYNNRHSRSFMKEAYPKFPYSEADLIRVYSELYKKQDATDLVFNHSPDTSLFLFLMPYISICNQKREMHSRYDKVKLLINVWPLQLTPLVKVYGQVLGDYFLNKLEINMVSIDPKTLNRYLILSNQTFFFDSFYTLTDESSSLYLPMFKDSLFFNHTVYAPYEVDDKIYQQWLAEGTDLSDESQFVLRFEPTQCYLNLCCKFSYMAFDIPVHEEDTDDKDDKSKIDEAKEYERQVKENSEKQKIKRHTPERAREMLNTVKPVKKNPFAKIYTPGKPNGS